jgi:hypothetical protein
VFELVGLQAGAYDLVAVAEEAGVRWQDPATLARLPGPAVRVTVADGQTVQQSLVVRHGAALVARQERRASARQTWPAEAGRSCGGPRGAARSGGARGAEARDAGSISSPPAGVNRSAVWGVEQENGQNRPSVTVRWQWQ